MRVLIVYRPDDPPAEYPGCSVMTHPSGVLEVYRPLQGDTMMLPMHESVALFAAGEWTMVKYEERAE